MYEINGEPNWVIFMSDGLLLDLFQLYPDMLFVFGQFICTATAIYCTVENGNVLL